MKTAGVAAPVLGLAACGFFTVYRPWQLRWGATDLEVEASMPGDGMVLAPVFNATRAITVDAEPEAVWPWIVQIGFGRAGWYRYDALDNLGHRSSDVIMPELQHMQVGDLVPLGPGEDAGMRIVDFEPQRWVIWGDKHQLTTWVWLLAPTPHHTTRMITRVRVQTSWRYPSTAAWLILDEIADFPMMRRCLYGIKERAET